MGITITVKEAAIAREALVQRIGVLTAHYVSVRAKDPAANLYDLAVQILDAQELANELRDAIDRDERESRIESAWLVRKAELDLDQAAGHGFPL